MTLWKEFSRQLWCDFIEPCHSQSLSEGIKYPLIMEPAYSTTENGLELPWTSHCFCLKLWSLIHWYMIACGTHSLCQMEGITPNYGFWRGIKINKRKENKIKISCLSSLIKTFHKFFAAKNTSNTALEIKWVGVLIARWHDGHQYSHPQKSCSFYPLVEWSPKPACMKNFQVT